MSAEIPPKQQPPSGPSSIDSMLRVLREVVAASIALLIVVGTTLMLYVVFSRYVGAVDQTGDKQFERAKDLLLFINPLLGVVIGYYFNKVTTEARAEKAEATVEAATTNAQEAIASRNAAEAEAAETKSALNEVIPAAEKMLKEDKSKGGGTLSVGDDSGRESRAWAELRAAVDRAQRVAR